MRHQLALVLALALVTVPAAQADHDRLDDEGDTEEATFVTGSLDGTDPDRNPTTGETDVDPEYCTEAYEQNPVHNGIRAPLIVAGGYCTTLEDDDPEDFGTFKLTVVDTDGNPAGFWWELVNLFNENHCAGGEYVADGQVTFTTSGECVQLTSFIDQTVPGGTVTLEKIG